jgi:hypothetical protein
VGPGVPDRADAFQSCGYVFRGRFKHSLLSFLARAQPGAPGTHIHKPGVMDCGLVAEPVIGPAQRVQPLAGPVGGAPE